MVSLAFPLVLLVLSACGAEKRPLEIVLGSPDVTVQRLESIIAFVNEHTPDGSSIDLGGYILTVWDNLEDVPCSNEEAIGCTGQGHIQIPWVQGYDADSAFALAHELGHVYYLQTTGNPDPNHTHHEWFDGVVSQVFKAVGSGQL